MSAEYSVGVVDLVRCEDVLTLRFERPRGYEFVPGQYFMLGIDTDEGAQTKPFSHASAPDDELLEMTTRVSGSAFKRALERVEPGRSTVGMRGPAGRFGLSEGDVGPPVFLAGGVGITPIMSILRDARNRGRELGASLIYGNAQDRCMPYADEIGAFASTLVRTTYVIERPSSGWSGLTGFITAEHVRGCISEIAGHCFYVTGPPVMVEAMEGVLDVLGVHDDARRIERFGSALAGEK